METTKNEQLNTEANKENSNKWWAGYIIAGIIWYYGQNFVKNPIDGLVVAVIAVWGWFYYHRLKAKLKVKNEALKILYTSFLILLTAMISIGFFTTLINRLFNLTA